MAIFEDTNLRKLIGLLDEIHKNQSALPNFQRDFVWSPNHTKSLISSIASNYPAGSILRVRDTKNLFEVRAIKGAPDLKDKHTFLILDGQQRLTSLYQAFYGTGERRYFIKIHDIISGKDFDECVFHCAANSQAAHRYQNSENQNGELVMPLSVLQNGSQTFLQWWYPDHHTTLSKDQFSKLSSKIAIINDYQFPVVTLSDKTPFESLCTIFETLNLTGVKLGVYDLLTARFMPNKINLRVLKDEAYSKNHPILEDFKIDPYYILQIISLASRVNPSCKRSDVLKLEVKDINEWWNKAVSALAQGLQILRDDCNVMLKKWIPYETMLLPLSATIAKLDPQKAEKGAHRAKIKQWFWCTVFSQSYESSALSQAATDTTSLKEWLIGGKPPEAVLSTKLNISKEDLRTITPKQNAIYRGIMCLMISNGMLDFHSGRRIDKEIIKDLEDHHIFPSAYLKGVNTDEKDSINSILNRTLIHGVTNKIINDRAPSEYLQEIKGTEGFEFDKVMASHCLSTDKNSPLISNDFKSFLNQRQEKIWEKICQAVDGQ